MSDNGKHVSPTNVTQQGSAPAVTASKEKSTLHEVFFGPNGLRAGWRIAIFVLLLATFSFLSRYIRQHLFHAAPRTSGAPFEPLPEIIARARGFLLLCLATLIMARIERGKWDYYGLPLRRAFSRDFWVGCLWGLVGVSAVMGGLWAAGAYRIDGLALAGAELWKFGVLWAVMFLIVGLLEEFTLRGYLLYTMASGMRFWPAAVITSALFLAGHIGNPGETFLGLSDVFIIGIFLCFTLWRTGDLWFAVGMHAVWDWGLTYLYSVPNSGTTAVGHLLNVRLQGPAWLSGGSAGPEGSVINLISDVLYFLIFAAIYKRRKWIGMNERRIATTTPAAATSVVIDSSALSS
jgi:membrane protease YdiL (CAAX protease family)